MPTPKHQRCEDNAKRIGRMVAYGINHDQIAAIIGVSDETLRKYYRDALDYGKSKAVERVANSLFETAVSGDVQAQKFFLSSRAGWSEKQTHEVSGKDGEALKVEHTYAGQAVKSLLDKIETK